MPVIAGGTVTIYRHNFEFDTTIQSYLQQLATYPYRRRFYVAAAGNGYLRLYTLTNNSDRDSAGVGSSSTNDVILCPGFGAITGFTFSLPPILASQQVRHRLLGPAEQILLGGLDGTET